MGPKWQAIVIASAVGSQANIEQIEFVSSVPSGATLIGSVGVTDETAATVWTENCEVFDVKAYYTALSTGKYKISFYSPYTIYAPQESSYLFSNSNYRKWLTNLTSISLGSFDTSKTIKMGYMFYGCSELTSLDVSNFNTSNVTNMDCMFNSCSKLSSLNVSSFNTSCVTDMWGMFGSCKTLSSLNVSNFTTSNVTHMSYIFQSCSKLTSLNVSNFNTSKVTNMYCMFDGCSSLTSLDVSNFDTSNVTNMGTMFSDCKTLTSLNVSNFNTSKVTSMGSMFSECYALTYINVSNFDTTLVKDFSEMFYYCKALTSLDISSFDFSAKNDEIGGELLGCFALTEIQTPKAIGSKAVDLPTPKTNYSWFDQANTNNAYTQITSSCTNKTLVLHENYSYLRTDWQTALTNNNANFKQANIKTIQFVNTVPSGSGYTQVSVGAKTSSGSSAFVSGTAGVSDITAYVKANSSDSTKYDVIFYSPVTIYAPQDSSYLFSSSTTANRLKNLTSISFGNFNTSNVTNMRYMFYNCFSLTSLNASNFNTSKVTNMSDMFWGCSKLTSLNVSNFNTSKVTDMKWMFSYCSSLTSLNVSTLDTSKVTNMDSMFASCSSLTSINLSSFDMSKVTSTTNMLIGCSSLTRINTPKTMGSKAVALPDNGKWINNANNNGPYSEITGAGMNNITLVIARNLILNYEEQVNCETRSAVLSGVTVTNNFDGSFTLNGTQTANIALASVKIKLNKGDHWGCYYTYISGSYTRTSGSLVAVDLKKENQDSLTTRTYISYGDPGTTSRWIGDETVDQVTSDETGTVYFWIWYNPGTSAGATEGGFTFNNLRIKLTFFRYYEAQTSSTLYCCKDAGLPKTVPVPTMEGKDFDGYYGIVDGAGIKYYDKDGKLLVTNFPDQANIRLYPKWTTKKHTTTINPNGGKYNNSTSNTTKTLEENQASDILTSVRDGYFNSSYTDTASRTYEAIYAKNAGVSFNGTASSFGVIPRTYMYTDKILISFEAYSSDWSNLNSQVMLSCTQNGGWSFCSSGGKICFNIYDSGRSSYMPATSNVAWSSLSAGWHEFTGSFDGQYARLYIDGQLCGMSYLFKGSIKYNSTNSIIVGAEAGSAATPDGNYFNGKIRNVIIANDYCDANTISTTAPGNNTGTPYITIGSTSDRTVTAQWQQDVVVDLDDCVTKPYTNLRLSSNTNGAWTTNKTSNGNYEYVFTHNSYKNASMSAGPHIQGLYSYMTHGQRYRITITAKSSKTFSVPMRFEAAAPDASKTINLTTSYQTFYLDFTYDSTTQYHSFTFYSKNYTAGQTITFKDIRISKLLAPSSTYGTLPTLTKTGYTFDGWWTAASNGTKVAENTTLTSNSRHTLYPRWIINESYLRKDWFEYLIDACPEINDAPEGETYWADHILSISFVNTIPSGTGYATFSVGATTIEGSTAYTTGTKNVSDVTAYIKANASFASKFNVTKYDLIFYSPVSIYAPTDSSNLFAGHMAGSEPGMAYAGTPFGHRLSSINFDNFNTSRVVNASYMFDNLYLFDADATTSLENELVPKDLDLTMFDTSNITNMRAMFYGSYVNSLNLSSFDMSEVTETTYMLDFDFIYTINTPKKMNNTSIALPGTWVDQANRNNIYTEITKAITNKTLILVQDSSFLRKNWKTALTGKNSNYTTSNIKTIKFTNEIPTGSGYTIISVGATSDDGATAWNETYRLFDVKAYVKANSSNSSKYDVIFYSPVTIYAPINSSELLSSLGNLTSISFGNFNTSNVTDMHAMFDGCYSLTSLDVSSFDTSNVTDMHNMFDSCSALTKINISNFNTTNVTYMHYMFYNCRALTSLSLSNFNTDNVTDMQAMFERCYALTTLNISSFYIKASTTNMFNSCSALKTINTPKGLKTGKNILLPSTSHYSWYKSTDPDRAIRYEYINSSNISSTLQLKKTMYTITITGSSGSNGSFNVNGAESGTIRLEAGTQFTISMHCWGYAFNSAYINWSISGNATIDSWNKWGDVNSATCDTTNKSGRLLCKSTVSMNAYMEVKVTIHGDLTINRSGGKK